MKKDGTKPRSRRPFHRPDPPPAGARRVAVEEILVGAKATLWDVAVGTGMNVLQAMPGDALRAALPVPRGAARVPPRARRRDGRAGRAEAARAEAAGAVGRRRGAAAADVGDDDRRRPAGAPRPQADARRGERGTTGGASSRPGRGRRRRGRAGRASRGGSRRGRRGRCGTCSRGGSTASTCRW